MKSTTKAYIDIDGVLLTREMTIPDHAETFIDFLLQSFDCHWLTTHCRAGENKTIQYLRQFYPPDILERLQRIKPTDWLTLKTEAIDMQSNFIWLEDYPFESEKKMLSTDGKIESLMIVNLSRPNELMQVQRSLINLKSL